jgi:hypothetical protein
MEVNPLEEWQRLTAVYAEMWDEELLNLAAAPEDLTETARQVLRDEVRKRGLRDPRAAREQPEGAARFQTAKFGAHAGPEFETQAQEGDDLPVEFTWKTPLCVCESLEDAMQVFEALRRAGLESWIQRPGARRPVAWNEWHQDMVGNIQVLVPADQLDQARAIVAQPIPQDIVDESKMQTPEFEAPVCPRCGASDPVLESVEPVNAWACESCGAEWTEPA